MKPAQIYPQQTLARKSELFEAGEPAAAPDDQAFLRRLNALVSMHRMSSTGIRPPKTLADAVRADGRLKEDAELLAFGQWLMIEDAPGLRKHGGQAVQPRIVLQTLGTAMAELHVRQTGRTSPVGLKTLPAGSKLTITALANRWERIFSEQVKPSDFSGRMRSLKRLLPAYLAYMKAGGFLVANKTATESRLIKSVLNLIDGKTSSRTATKSSAKT